MFPPTLWPQEFEFNNFAVVMQSTPFLTYLRNSIFYAIFETVLVLLVSLLSAYGFFLVKNKAKMSIILLMLLVDAVPFEVVMIYNFRSIINWSMHNSIWALILPFVCNFSYVFILYNAFEKIPKSLYYSARLDRTSNIKYLFKIAIPYIKSTVIFVCLINLVGAWNSFLWPLLVTSSDSSRTLPIGIYSFVPENGSKTELVMAMSVLSQLPLIILFFIFQKYFLNGTLRSKESK